jgi:hypothetical protein
VFGYVLHLLVQGHQGPRVFSRAILAEELDAVGDEGPGVTTTVDVQTHLQAFFEHVPKI